MILLQKILPVFLVLFLGVLCRKKNLLTREGVNALKKVAVDIALPAVMFSAFATAEYSVKSICVPLTMFTVCCIALFLGFFICRRFSVPGRLSPFLAAGFEAGMLGYALFVILFPNESLSSFALVDLGQVLFVFTVYKILLSGKGSLKTAVKDACMSPTIWAIGLGLAVGATGLYQALIPSGISKVLDSVTDFVSAPTSVLILLSIGYDLSAKLQWRKMASLIAMRIGISGVLLVAVLLFDKFVLGGMMSTTALLMMFVLPPPYVLPVFADVEEERSDISSALSSLTLVSIVLFAVLAACL
jgi:predicted permease